MVKGDRKTWKQNYFTKLLHLLDEYPKLFIVGVDNVGSNQMQKIRIALRGKAELLMGKNTMIRKAIRGHLEERPELEALLPFVKQNVGFVFTKGDLSEVRTLLLNNKVQAPARAGAIAPLDVFVPPGSTGMGPEKTAFFQALAIPTKIARGVIEIQNEIHLIKAGEKVGASEATLLNMLDISPFQYGCELIQVYDNGETYTPTVLDITKDDIVAEFKSAITLVASLSISIGYPNAASAEFLVKHSIKETRDNIASISLAVGYPTLASAPHTVAKAFKNLLAIAAVTDVTFKEAEATKAFLADPSAALAAVAAPAAAAASGGAKKEEKKEESEEESSGGGMGMFGDDDDGF